MKPKKSSLLSKIAALHPRDFENLCYDLLIHRGLKNVQWRTPGADGGRDIQGEWPMYDFSGNSYVEKWYIECKRYKSAVDWPTAFGKIAFAENHNADYLLFCTTSTLSPQCKDEIMRRSSPGYRLIVRAWEGHELERMISRDPVLLYKYGLSKVREEIERASLPTLLLVSKAAQQAYGSSSNDGIPDPSVEFAAAASEFVATVMSDTSSSAPPTTHLFYYDRDRYPWVTFTGAAKKILEWNPFALRAILTAVRFMTNAKEIKVKVTESPARLSEILEISPGIDPRSSAAVNALNAIATLADIEWILRDQHMLIQKRDVR